jgi:hypothetical protein
MLYVDETFGPDGLVERIEYDTDADTVTTTVPPEGPETRPMTPEEIVEFTQREEAEVASVNTAEIVAESDPAVDKLIAVVEALNTITSLSNATINANPAAVIKDVARELKTVARQLNHEVRLTAGRLESTDTGEVVP